MYLYHLRFAINSPEGLMFLGWKSDCVYGEVQFAAAEAVTIGPDRNRFPALDHVQKFLGVIQDRWNMKGIVSTSENPVTLESIAREIHEQAKEHVRLYPLIAVHAVRLSNYDDFSDAITYLTCAVPLHVVHGQVTYKKPGGSTDVNGVTKTCP